MISRSAVRASSRVSRWYSEVSHTPEASEKHTAIHSAAAAAGLFQKVSMRRISVSSPGHGPAAQR